MNIELLIGTRFGNWLLLKIYRKKLQIFIVRCDCGYHTKKPLSSYKTSSRYYPICGGCKSKVLKASLRVETTQKRKHNFDQPQYKAVFYVNNYQDEDE